jgi:hypothetical protein
MQPNGRKIVKDLITHRNLWTVMSEQDDNGKENFIKLRDLENYSFGIICIGIRKDRKKEFERLAERWNPLAIQYLQEQDQQNGEMRVELCFG